MAHNERLELLGDAVLGAVVADLIYRSYPEMAEGEMARLRSSVVNTVALAELGQELDLGEHIKLGRGEEASGGRFKASLLANTFEAVVGAVYLERGFDCAAEHLAPIFLRRLSSASVAQQRYDAKTALQEVVVADRGELPSYRLASSGPDHDKRFIADVFVGRDLFGSGQGKSKKEAEQNAARAALLKLARPSGAGGGAAGAEPKGGVDARAS
jgi:ribonuclease-3